jgi:predicted transcriptional regulator
MSTPTVTIIDDSAARALSPDVALDEIKALQEAIAELQKRRKAIIAPVKAWMKAKGETKFTNANGVVASIYDTNRTNADKKVASEVLDGDTYAQIFKVSTVSNFKVK